MPTYTIMHKCGHAEKVFLTGSKEERERIILSKEGDLCSACTAENNSKLDAEMNLPELIGTEKQVIWASQIRRGYIKNMDERVDAAKDYPGKENDLAIYAHFRSNTRDAIFWIDNRHLAATELLAEYMKRYEEELARMTQELDEKNDAAAIAAKAESTLMPENPVTCAVCEVKIEGSESEGCISLYANKDEKFRMLVKSKEYEWKDRAWRREIRLRNGPVEDRAAEIVNALLLAGFPVLVFDEEIRRKAVSADFEPEKKRWITYDVKLGRLTIFFERNDDVYSAAKSLPFSRWERGQGAVSAPLSSRNAVLDFAAAYDFSISPKAQRMLDEYGRSEEAMLKVKPVKQPEREEKDRGIAGVLDSSREVLEDLKDEA